MNLLDRIREWWHLDTTELDSRIQSAEEQRSDAADIRSRAEELQRSLNSHERENHLAQRFAAAMAESERRRRHA
jgi:uncharacterized tellurite resistance protein B-like protein